MLKRCGRGDDCIHPLGCWQPATLEYFGRHNRTRDKMTCYCKLCGREYNRSYRAEHAERLREQSYSRYVENREASHIRERRYRAKNADKVKERGRLYRSAHADELRDYRKRYYSENADYLREQQRRYSADNRHIYKAITHRRLARKRGLSDEFTVYDWQRALDYFNGCCAVCGRPLRDLFGTHKPAADHWIPLTDPRPDNPGTVPANIVPLCHGVGGCNNRKSNRDPVEFLETEFGKRKAAQILKRINAYFASLTAQENAA